MDNETIIPVKHRDLIKHIIKESRYSLENGHDLATIVFFGNSITKKYKKVVLPRIISHGTSTEEIIKNAQIQKDLHVEIIRQEAVDFGADMILMVTEAWTLDKNHTHQYAEIIEKYGEIGRSPFRVDSVFFNLQTTTDTYSGLAKIIPKGIGKKRTFLTVEWKSTPIQGRYANLLSRKGTDKS